MLSVCYVKASMPSMTWRQGLLACIRVDSHSSIKYPLPSQTQQSSCTEGVSVTCGMHYPTTNCESKLDHKHKPRKFNIVSYWHHWHKQSSAGTMITILIPSSCLASMPLNPRLLDVDPASNNIIIQQLTSTYSKTLRICQALFLQ